MRVHVDRDSYSPGDTITGSVFGTLKRTPRSITVQLVIQETATGQLNDRVICTVNLPVPVGSLELRTPISLTVPTSAVPGHEHKKGQTEWTIVLNVDIPGIDQTARANVSVKDDRPLNDLRQHPALPDAEHAIKAQEQRLGRMIAKQPAWLTGLLTTPVLAFSMLGFASNWFGLSASTFVVIAALLIVPGTILSAVFWFAGRRPPSGVTLQVPTMARKGTSIAVSVTVNDPTPMIACLTSHTIVMERHQSAKGRGSDEERVYKIDEQCFELNQGTNTLTIEVPQSLPATYSSEIVSFAHQVRVRRAPRLGLPSRFEPHVSQMIAVLS